MDYIWFDDNIPILNQVKDKFENAIIILNPFIIMPLGWTHNKQIGGSVHLYPSYEEMIESGKPMIWNQLLNKTGIEDFASLALAMKTYISALNKDYARNDLMEKLELGLDEDLFLPNEDKISHFLVPTILEAFASKKVNTIHVTDPIFDTSQKFSLEEFNIQELYESTSTEIMITDEHNDMAFMSVYDSFITLMLTNDQSVLKMINNKGWEIIQCDKYTKIDWYLK